MEYVKKITDKSELFDENGRLKYHSLANFDLCGLDLSDIDPSVWEHLRFFNTNFKNTGIKFIPAKLMSEYSRIKGPSLEFCNFENCDLSYLTDEDMLHTNIRGTNFRNTKLQVDFRNNKVFSLGFNPYGAVTMQDDSYRVNLKDGTILPIEYGDKPIYYFDYADLDIKFLENNPHIKISSGKLFEAIAEYFCNCYSTKDKIREEDFKNYYQTFLKFLEYDKEGKLKRFYSDMEPYFTCKEHYLDFFQGKVKNLEFDDLDLTYLDKKMLTSILFIQCDFYRLKLGVSYKELNKEQSRKQYISFMKSTSINELILPTSIHDWQNAGRRRLHGSKITMYTNLYLEFERICNMCCEFCRNETLEESPFDFNQIMNTFKRIYLHLNNVVVGGGEPTLYLKELKDLSQIINNLKRSHHPKLSIITNCSLNYEEYNALKSWRYKYNFYFSRHAVEDEENKRIFGDKYNQIMTTEDLMCIHERDKDTMCCTCMIGGTDSVSKILEYVRYVEYIGYQNILFQNLHLEDENNIPINIEERIMIESMEKLREQGFLVSQPIISNSNYVLYLLKKDKFTISFKIYKLHSFILDAWNKSPKRCFDISIDPSGNLHETWKEPNDITNSRKQKRIIAKRF